ncbi:hypothetical protein SAMN04488069_11318 [Hymenobacter psychrophilus]|uniref:Uncharacterized protein n=1 Tax=Hymenobacter psychrophilus TaxID=651662 RepID=A0A1H3MIX7_9BACT|nr:hypothetical protein SAMN04488069_11318 [Hymenobacter psychrophilus]
MVGTFQQLPTPPIFPANTGHAATICDSVPYAPRFRLRELREVLR